MTEPVVEAHDQLSAASAAQEQQQVEITITPQHRRRGARPKEFTLHQEERSMQPLFRIRGETPERWVAQTNFYNDEAVGYLADRLERLGIEKALMNAGARPGDAVVIGDDGTGVVFGWERTMTNGAVHLAGPRGQEPPPR